VADVLERGGYSPRNVLYPNHAFVAVRSDAGREYVVDPTFGVLVDRSLAVLRVRPALVRPYYTPVRSRSTLL
jgi:hypothetical protein